MATAGYFGAYAIVTASSGFWVRRFRWPTLCAVGFGLMLTGTALCLAVGSMPVMQAGLVILGLGSGILFPISFAMAGEVEETTRVFAIKLTAEQLVPAGMLLLLTAYTALMSPVYDLFAGLLVLVVASAVVTFLSGNWSDGSSVATETAEKGSRVLAVLSLIGLFVSFCGFAGVWAFLERIANVSGLDGSFTGRWLAVGLVASGVGPLMVAFVGDRIGRTWVIAGGSLVAVASLALLAEPVTETMFAVALVSLPLGYYIAVSYMLAVIADADYNGRNAALVSFVLAMGAIGGPAVFGYLLGVDGPSMIAMATLMISGAIVMTIVASRLQNPRV